MTTRTINCPLHGFITLTPRMCQIVDTKEFKKLYDSGITHLNIGSGYEITIRDLAKMIAEIVGFTGELDYDNSKPDGASYKVVDINIINAEIAWKPYTSFESGLEKTVAWFSKNYDKWLANSTLA